VRYASVPARMVGRFGTLVPAHYLGPSVDRAAYEWQQARRQFRAAKTRLATAQRRYDRVKDLPDGLTIVEDPNEL
jgi:hypothetical protein